MLYEVITTDGSKLYPTALAEVWPQAAHQLCLFHETRRVTQAVMKAINAIRKSLPEPPPALGIKPGGPLHPHPPSPDPHDPATRITSYNVCYTKLLRIFQT